MPATLSSPASTARAPRGREIRLAAARNRAIAGHFLADHLGWWHPVGHPFSWCRLVEDGETQRLITSPDIHAAEQRALPFDVIDLPTEVRLILPHNLASRLAARAPLLRVATPTVWEAAATAVVRQVVHRDQARAAYARLARTFGTPVMVGGQVRHTFPTARQVLAVSETQLRGCSIGFKAKTLRSLAEWSIEHRQNLEPEALHEAILHVRGVGPWTAAVTVCDRFSDFSFYPVDDLAVRAHARARWHRDWPESPLAFAREWRAATAPHTAAITAFILADAVLSET